MLFPIAILLILAMLLWLPGLPFGTKKNMPVYIEQGILALDRIYINGDWRGYLVGLDPGCWSACCRPAPCSARWKSKKR